MIDESVLFELHITPDLIRLWKRYGLNKDERECEKQSLNNLLAQRYLEYIESIKEKCRSTEEEIESMYIKCAESMKSYGYSQDEIEETLKRDMSVSLRQQLQSAKEKYDEFCRSCQDRKDKMVYLMNELDKSFNALGIDKNERGEFAELGETDFTLERISRMQEKLHELQIEKQKRIEIVQKLKEKITSLACELSLTVEEDITTYLRKCVVTESSIQSLRECKRRLKNIREERVKSISKMAIEIYHLWDLLEVGEEERNRFLRRHSTLGIDVINSCQSEIKRLSASKEEKLQSLIDSQREELNSLWEFLHIPKKDRVVIQQMKNKNEEFSQIEKEILKMKEIKLEFYDILTLIHQREEILKNWNECKNASSDPNRLISRTHEGAKRLMREAQSRTDYKTTLPKLEKKLLATLIEHKNSSGKDFMWDGEPYINKLSHVSLADNESVLDNMSNSKKSNSTVCKSPIKRTVTNSSKTMSVRSPPRRNQH